MSSQYSHLEELNFESFKLQLGGRLEDTRYEPEGLADRSFTGVSASAGVHIPLWQGGALVTNYTHSYRAPAIEELYNNGPHLGNLAFEIGDPNLKRERSDGVDVSLRHIGTGLKSKVICTSTIWETSCTLRRRARKERI